MGRMEYLVKLLVAGFFILLALHFLRPRAAFRITVRGERIAVTGLLPGGKGAEVVSFFRQELPEVSRAREAASPRRGGPPVAGRPERAAGVPRFPWSPGGAAVAATVGSR